MACEKVRFHDLPGVAALAKLGFRLRQKFVIFVAMNLVAGNAAQFFVHVQGRPCFDQLVFLMAFQAEVDDRMVGGGLRVDDAGLAAAGFDVSASRAVTGFATIGQSLVGDPFDLVVGIFFPILGFFFMATNASILANERCCIQFRRMGNRMGSGLGSGLRFRRLGGGIDGCSLA